MVPVSRFQYFRHLLQNPNLTLMSSFPNNHYWAYTFLNPWALTFCHLPNKWKLDKFSKDKRRCVQFVIFNHTQTNFGYLLSPHRLVQKVIRYWTPLNLCHKIINENNPLPLLSKETRKWVNPFPALPGVQMYLMNEWFIVICDLLQFYCRTREGPAM